MISRFNIYLIALLFILFILSCKKDKPDPVFNDGKYPPHIAEIIVKKCATSGCHNTASKDAASGLDLSTWDKMFEGNSNGAVVVPYRSDQSTLFYFVNTDSTLGIVQQPTMPYDQTPLSQSEVIAIRDWIDNGAPDKNGFVKFSDNPDRRKFYISNQSCDLIGVHDPDSRVVMRYINVGSNAGLEFPHMIRVSPDGQYWYVSFLNSDVFQKYRTSDNSFVAQAVIGLGSWNTFAISADGSKAFVIDFSGAKVAYVNLDNMNLATTYIDPGTFATPHGCALNPAGNKLYVTNQTGNSVFMWDITDPLAPEPPEIIPVYSGGPPLAQVHEIIFSPDGSKYFVTCQGINEVRVFNAADDSFLAAIPTALLPQEMSVSSAHNYLFVSCMTGNSVTVIDMDNLTKIKDINTGFEPHGLAVDDVKNVVYVANRNTPSSGGPPPHHTSSCGGRNGYLTIIDMNTLELIPGFKMELSVDPYSIAVKN